MKKNVGPRYLLVEMWATPTEKTVLQNAARLRGMSRAAFIRQVALDKATEILKAAQPIDTKEGAS
jgi:uncharacterized protein (DUF1778 family)